MPETNNLIWLIYTLNCHCLDIYQIFLSRWNNTLRWVFSCLTGIRCARIVCFWRWRHCQASKIVAFLDWIVTKLDVLYNASTIIMLPERAHSLFRLCLQWFLNRNLLFLRWNLYLLIKCLILIIAVDICDGGLYSLNVRLCFVCFCLIRFSWTHQRNAICRFIYFVGLFFVLVSKYVFILSTFIIPLKRQTTYD